MDTIQHALIKLEADRVNNISIINFIKNNRILSTDIIGNSVLAKGISDRRWVYISCPDEDELIVLKNQFNPDDKNFAAIDDWMVSVLTEGKELVWDLSMVKFYLPDDVRLPPQKHKTGPLTKGDAHTVYANSTYKEYISLEYAADCINKGTSAGIYEDNKLVCWAITQDDGAIGFLHTLKNYRKRGYAYCVTLSMIEKLRDHGELPFAYVEADNKKSIDLLLKLGFKKSKIIHWFEIK